MQSYLQQGEGKAPSAKKTCVFMPFQICSIIPSLVYVQQSKTRAQPNKGGETEMHTVCVCVDVEKGRKMGQSKSTALYNTF